MINWSELVSEAPLDSMYRGGVEFRKIRYTPAYFIDAQGRVYSQKSNRILSPDPKKNTVVLYSFGTKLNRSIRSLLKDTWPENYIPKNTSEYTIRVSGESIWINDTEYRKIPRYSNYVISRDGVVFNLKFERFMTIYHSNDNRRNGRGQVTLSRNSKHRSIRINTILQKVYGTHK